MTQEQFDLDKFCKRVNECMDWMKMGVTIAVFISLSSILASAFAVYVATWRSN